MSSSAIPTSVQNANRDNVAKQQVEYWNKPTDPHDSRTTASADWKRQAKDAGLIKD